MKKTLLFLTLAFTIQNYSQNVAIPDTNFKTALLAHGVTINGADISKIDTNDDGEIQVTEATSYSGFIYVDSKNISDLTGIEAFTNIVKLSCASNLLTSLNVTQNTTLESLTCRNNQLTILDLTQNTSLTLLWCSSNSITSLDLTQNTLLESLSCGFNELTTLDVTQNTVLSTLGCDTNQLTTLDVTQNVLLENLAFGNNQLTTINLAQNTTLEDLECYNNQLTTLNLTQQNSVLKNLVCNGNPFTTLDLSQLTVLTSVYCYSNQLTSLNIANGNNSNMTTFRANDNPNLTCIQIDNGFTPPTTTAWQKDATASYSSNCTLSTTTFELSKQVTIFPNPAKDYFQITLKNNLELETVTVYNNLGQKVMTSNSSKVNIEPLAKGIYHVETITNKGKIFKNIVIE
jgi:Leucine-rich repeat (LRR) protein